MTKNFEINNDGIRVSIEDSISIKEETTMTNDKIKEILTDEDIKELESYFHDMAEELSNAIMEAIGKVFAEEEAKETKEDAGDKEEETPELKTDLAVSAPWYTYYKMVTKMFELDPDVYVTFKPAKDDNEYNKLIIRVCGDNEKAEAIASIFPIKVVFGSVYVDVIVLPSNGVGMVGSRVKSNIDKFGHTNAFIVAFKGNDIVDQVLVKNDSAGLSHTHVVFKPRIAQFYNDELWDLYGYKSILFADAAKEIFRDDMPYVHYCTAVVDSTKEK